MGDRQTGDRKRLAEDGDRQETDGRRETGGRKETRNRRERETRDRGKTGDRIRETGDNALTSKAGVRKSNFCLCWNKKS